MLNKLQVISTTPERNIVSNNASPNSSVILSYTPPRPATPSTCEETRSNTSSSFRSSGSASSSARRDATATTPERHHRYKLPPTTPGSPVKNSNSHLQCLYTDQSLDYLVQYGVLDRSEAQAMSSTPTAVDQSQNNVDILDELTLALDQKLALCTDDETNETDNHKQQHKRKRVGFLEQRRTNDELLHMFQGWSHQQQQQHKRSHSLEDNDTLGSLVTTAEEAENAKNDIYECFPNNDHSHSAYSNSVRSSKPSAASIPSMRIPSMCSYSESEQSSKLFGERALEQQQRTPMAIDGHPSTFIPKDNPPAASYRLERTTPHHGSNKSSSNHRYRFGLMTTANDSKDYLSYEDTLTGDDISKPKYGESKFDTASSSQSQVPFDERTTTHRDEDEDFVHVSKKFLSEAGAVMRRMSNEISKQLSCATRLPEEFEICRNGKQDRTIVTPPPPPLLADDYLHIRDDQETISHLDSKLSYEFGYEYDCSEQPARMQQQQHHIVHPPSSHPHTNGFYPVTRPVVFKAADV